MNSLSAKGTANGKIERNVKMLFAHARSNAYDQKSDLDKYRNDLTTSTQMHDRNDGTCNDGTN